MGEDSYFRVLQVLHNEEERKRFLFFYFYKIKILFLPNLSVYIYIYIYMCVWISLLKTWTPVFTLSTSQKLCICEMIITPKVRGSQKKEYVQLQVSCTFLCQQTQYLKAGIPKKKKTKKQKQALISKYWSRL